MSENRDPFLSRVGARVRRRGFTARLATFVHRRIAPGLARYEAEGESFAYLDELAATNGQSQDR